MPIIAGLLVAFGFGTGDFLGGLGSRRAPTLAVLAIAQVCGLFGAIAVAVVGGGSATGGDLAFGALAGVLNVVALGCLYQGLAVGQIGQVAPIAAIVGASIPVAWGLATGERPSGVALVGVVLAVVAGGLVSADRDERRPEGSRRAIGLAVAAGLGFGTSFVCFAAASHHTGFWPVLSARSAAVAAVLLALLVTRTNPAIARVPTLQAVAAGALDVTATALLLVAIRSGLTSTVAPIAALAPGVNVAHAWWYLHEKASRLQLVGLAVGLAGLVLIAAGT